MKRRDFLRGSTAVAFAPLLGRIPAGKPAAIPAPYYTAAPVMTVLASGAILYEFTDHQRTYQTLLSYDNGATWKRESA